MLVGSTRIQLLQGIKIVFCISFYDASVLTITVKSLNKENLLVNYTLYALRNEIYAMLPL